MAAGFAPVSFLAKYKARTRPNFTLSMAPTEIGSGKQDWWEILPAAHAATIRKWSPCS